MAVYTSAPDCNQFPAGRLKIARQERERKREITVGYFGLLFVANKDIFTFGEW
jgi:hypothetical protein